jgi:hypothetical protein
MKIFFIKRIASPLINERGVAALVSIILAIIVLGSVAFNFIAETRQKQSGSILTYTSTNALMIAESGLRYTEKCLLEIDAGCPAAIQNVSDWTTITAAANFNKDFGGDGNFAITFPGHANNDAGNIFVTSTGTFKGGQRSLSRFISRACILGENAVSSCSGTSIKNNSTIDPTPNPPPDPVCPPDPPGIVGPFPVPPTDCDACDGSSALCPDFDPNVHLVAGNFLDPAITTPFCNFKLINGDEVKTNEASFLNIIVGNDFEIIDNATLKLNDDAVDPLDATKDTTITVYGNANLNNNGEIRVKGTLTLNVGTVDPVTFLLEADTGAFDMKNSSRVNNNAGEAANASVWAEGDITIKNSTLLVGSVASDGIIELQNNAEVQGALQGYEVKLRNNATVVYTDNENAGSNSSGYSLCGSGETGQNWSE